MLAKAIASCLLLPRKVCHRVATDGILSLFLLCVVDHLLGVEIQLLDGGDVDGLMPGFPDFDGGDDTVDKRGGFFVKMAMLAGKAIEQMTKLIGCRLVETLFDVGYHL